MILIICVVIFVVVFGAMFYALWKHRKSVGHKAEQFHENTTVEIVWTVIPFIILIGMAYPATKTVLAMKDTADSDMTIKATGYQWKWRYDYLNEDVSFYSNLSTPRDQIENQAPKGEHYLLEVDNPMVVPVGKRVRILTTANDVIHSWSVPAFGVKQDAIPGFVRDAWFKVDTPGTYRGQCSELCGKEHGFMPIVVEAVPEDKVQGVGGGAEGQEDPVRCRLRGRREQDLHAGRAEGRGRKGLWQDLRGLSPAQRSGHAAYIPVARGRQDRDRADRGTRRHRRQRQQEEPGHGGVEDPAVGPRDRRVITYERNSFGNKTGDMVQPKDIAAARK